MFLDEADLDISNEDVNVQVQHSVRARQDKGKTSPQVITQCYFSIKNITMDKYR